MSLRNKKTIICIAAGLFILIAVLAVLFVGRPGKAEGLRGSDKAYDTVLLSWKPSKEAKSYTVYRAEGEEGEFQEVAAVREPSYTDKGVKTGVLYRYTVRVDNGFRKSWEAEETSVVTKLETPEFSTKSTENGPVLKAGKVPGATGYLFFRDGKCIRAQALPEYTDSEAEEEVTHRYRAVAFRSQGGKKVPSEKSREDSAKRIRVNVVLKGNNKIKKIMMGDRVDIKGTIQSNVDLQTVAVGVKDADEKKWIKGFKFKKKDYNKKNFDLEEADKELSFPDLEKGNYTYVVSVKTAGGKEIDLLEDKFEVTFNPAQAAVDWAIKIANDDSFAYGTGKACHRVGCYFCGTNQKNKPRGYEKTYVCLTFVGAAYAHGAQDPEILAVCQEGKTLPCYSSERNFTRFSCWTKVGSCGSLSIGDLKPGDVLVNYDASNSHGHVCMYAGGDMLVEAITEGWGAGTIAYHSGAARRLSQYGGKSQNFVMRYSRKVE